MVGGFSDPSVPRSPGASPQESRAAHGPRHPAVSIPPRLCRVCVCFFVRFSGMDVRCSVCFFVSGAGIMLLGLVPFRTRPLLAKMFVVLSFSLVVWLVSTTPFSLFLSGAGETQTHFGFGFPLVSLHSGHDFPLQSARLAPQLHQGSRPAMFFCFFSRRRSRGFFFGVWFSLSGLSVCLSVCLCMSALHARSLFHRFFGGRETIISPLLVMIIVICWELG